MNRLVNEGRKFYGYLKKDFLLLIRRKKYLYLSLLIPLLLALIFVLMISPSEYKIKMGVCDLDHTDLSKRAYSNLNSFEAVIYSGANCSDDLKRDVLEGKIPVGIRIGQGFSQEINNLQQSHVTIFYDNTDIAFSNLISWKVDSSLTSFKREIIDSVNNELKQRLEILRASVDMAKRVSSNSVVNDIDKDLAQVENINTEFIINPVWVNQEPVYEGQSQKDIGLIFVFPIIALFVILMLASTSLIYDIKTNFVTSVKTSTTILSYILAKVVFFIGIALVQFVIIAALFFAYGARFEFNLLGIINLILFVGVIDTLIGLIIGAISENEGIAILFSLLLSLPLMLLSGIFYPSQTMPRIFQYLESILPLSYQIDRAKDVLLFGNNFGLTWVWGAVGLFIVFYVFIRKKH